MSLCTIYLGDPTTFWSIVRREVCPERQMQTPYFRVFLALAMIWQSSAIVLAASLDPPRSKLREGKTSNRHADPCLSGQDSIAPPTASWRAQINQRSAVYIIQHVQKACQLLADRRNQDPKLASRLNSTLDDLHATVLSPIYRAHPELEGAVLPALRPTKAVRATRFDVGRATAGRFVDDITRIQRQIGKLGGEDPDQYHDKNAAERAMQPFVDATAELSFAEKIAFDAYPGLFSKLNDAIPQQSRTEESDAVFRKGAPPLGSVRLSEAALAFVKSFMRLVRRKMPREDQIASIIWTREEKSKGPGDTNWINRGAGWILGAYSRTQVPPEVIDKIQNVEVIFSAEDPSLLAGKVVDVRNNKLFVRD
jgi:hypothetical protein